MAVLGSVVAFAWEIAYYSLDGDGLDSSGNGLHGTVVGALPAQDRFSNEGAALSFDGVGDFVDLGPLGLINQPFSIAGWYTFPVAPVSTWHALFSESQGALTKGILVSQRNVGGDLRLIFVIKDESGTAYQVQSLNPIPVGIWTHFAAVRGVDSIQLYVDGILQETTVVTSWTDTTITNTAKLGRQSGEPRDDHWGRMDEVRLFDSALSAGEVSDLAEAFVPGVLTEGLSAYYPLNGDTSDATGNGFDGVASSLSSATDRFGNPGGCYFFNGVDGAITVDNLPLANRDFSLSVWVRRDGDEFDNDTILGQGGVAVRNLDLNLTYGRRHDTGLMFAFYANDLDISPSQLDNFDLGQWVHLIATYDAELNRRRVYRNGVLVGEDVANGDFAGSGPLYIGTSPFGEYRFFHGLIDDVRIYSRELDAADAAALHSFESQPPPSEIDLPIQNGLIAYWPFTGNTDDQTGNGHHGSNQGAVWAVDRYGNAASALDFLGGPSAVYVDSNPFSSVPEGFTVSLWANARSWDSTQQQFLFYLKDSDPNLQFLMLGFRDGIFKYESGNYSATYPEADIALNQWHHFAMTWDGGIISGYLDGRLVAMVAAPSVSPGSGRANPIITIGRNQEFESAGFDGRIDDIALYDRALSSREIEELAFQADWVVPSLGMEMLAIESGAFVMGSPSDEVGRRSDEGPLTQVTISQPFWIGKYEVTQAEWTSLMNGNPSRTVGEQIAVHKVNWFAAVEFCDALTQLEGDAGRLPEGYSYRLPTEAEWEFAVRAGTQTRFFYGDDPDYLALPEYAWYLPNQNDQVHEVGLKLPNSRGLYDVYGNVAEWCYNWWYPNLEGGQVTDPVGPPTGTKRGVRGGHRGNSGDRLRSAWRSGAQFPNDIGLNFGYGFRVVLAPVLEVDETPPTLTCPLELIVELDSGCSGVVPDLLPLVSMEDDVTPTEALIVTQSPPAGTLIGMGETLVRFEVEDLAGNVARCDVVVIGVDTTPPSLACETPGEVLTNELCLGEIPSIGYLLDDNCGQTLVSIRQAPSAGTLVAKGQHVVVVTATDAAGNEASCSVVVDVVDRTAPVLSCVMPAAIGANEQCLVQVPEIAFEVTDACSEENVAVVQYPAAGSWVGLGHHAVTLTATDEDGNQSTCAVDLWVVDLTPPSIVSFSAPHEPTAIDEAVAVSASVSDNCGLFTVQWDWGDGTNSTGTLSGNSQELAETHLYSSPGVYTVALSVIDESGNLVQSLFQYVVVYDPEGGFVTGGGQIESPVGAFRWNPTATGIAHFGFSAKYRRGASIPTGQTAFRFRDGNFTFRATQYDWLVIAGSNAKYKGVGEVDGESGYSFMLTASDGDLNGGNGGDTLRLKVWDTETEAVVYDNLEGEGDDSNLGQDIRRGNIVIHRP